MIGHTNKQTYRDYNFMYLDDVRMFIVKEKNVYCIRRTVVDTVEISI